MFVFRYFYYLDSDEDDYPDQWQSAVAGAAFTDHIDSGCGVGIAGNIIFQLHKAQNKKSLAALLLIPGGALMGYEIGRFTST